MLGSKDVPYLGTCPVKDRVTEHKLDIIATIRSKPDISAMIHSVTSFLPALASYR